MKAFVVLSLFFSSALLLSSCASIDEMHNLISGKKVSGQVIQYSTGSNWALANATPGFIPRMGFGCEVFKENIWVVGGYAYTWTAIRTNDIWFSRDGSNWNCANTSAEYSGKDEAGLVVFHDQLWLIGGSYGGAYTNDVWCSADGTNWHIATSNAGFRGRCLFGCTVFQDNIWVIGGYFQTNDIWRSADGTNWICVSTNADFEARAGFSLINTGYCLYIVAGLGNSSSLNDVWISYDGTNWDPVNTNAQFSPRYSATGLFYNNTLWLIGGYNHVNDVWKSADGTNWTQVLVAAPFTPRFRHSSVVYQNKMWVIGGNANTGFTNDVWYSDLP